MIIGNFVSFYWEKEIGTLTAIPDSNPFRDNLIIFVRHPWGWVQVICLIWKIG